MLPGAEGWSGEGRIWAEVGEGYAQGAILEVVRAPAKGGKIKVEKGVNLRGADLRVAALTSEDLAALDFVVGHADIVAFSFVQTVADVQARVGWGWGGRGVGQ